MTCDIIGDTHGALLFAPESIVIVTQRLYTIQVNFTIFCIYSP